MSRERSLARRRATAGLAPRTVQTLCIRPGGRIAPVERPDDETAQGYLRLTAHILVQAQHRVFRTIGVVSALRGEGKTTAALNLAVCLGRTRGRMGRVLLVDGDTRSRTLTRLLTGPSVVDTPTAEGGARHPMLVTTAFENVDLMTAPDVGGTYALHDPAAWAESLHRLAERYEQIIVDCPSVLEDPEGLILRDCADELVLVVRAGLTPRDAVERALGAMRRRVIGTVLNGGRRPAEVAL